MQPTRHRPTPGNSFYLLHPLGSCDVLPPVDDSSVGAVDVVVAGVVDGLVVVGELLRAFEAAAFQLKDIK